MKKETKFVILSALLGIIIGVLATTLTVRLQQNKRELQARLIDWGKLNLILRTAQEHYVDTIDFGKVTEAAASAALSALDPHSVYIPSNKLQDVEDELSSNFEGIGIQFNVPNDTAIVLEVIPGGPSEKIGLQKGDRIIKVDDKVIAGVKFPQDSMVRRMKGPAGTKVTVTVKRENEAIPFEITRGKIPTHCVDAAFMIDGKTAYLRLSKFSATTATEVSEAGATLREQGMKRLILDLRDNTGGYLDQAIKLSNMFLYNGQVIVSTKGLHSPSQVMRADGEGALQDIGLAVLMNENSASSSEIFAGAIQDNDRGRIVGRRSYGKGLVQEPFYFTDGSAMRVTVARYYTPGGRCIQKPISDDYNYDFYNRYESGELVNADSMKVENGGIIPDLFVPMDTTRAGSFYLACNKKATTMRFASSFFDANKSKLLAIDDYSVLLDYLDAAALEPAFLQFARNVDGLAPAPGEWKKERSYMMTQVRALVGRYSKLGDQAFYHIYLDIDDTVNKALELLSNK